MEFEPSEREACIRIGQSALDEDLDAAGDVTSQATIPHDLPGQAVFVARQEGILAGLQAAEITMELVDPELKFTPLIPDGTPLRPGMQLAQVTGRMRPILAGERTALNFLQRLSGIASITHTYADRIADLPCRLLDTRKTIPGWRHLEKYAVRCGGGHNHRLGLFDGILIKDNHLAALGTGPAIVAEAVQRARKQHGTSLPIEVEVDTLEQLDYALKALPTMILLDNMSLEQLREAVQRRNAIAPGVLLEASGGVNLTTLRSIAETGVDRISVGAITHSAPALDIGLDYSR